MNSRQAAKKKRKNFSTHEHKKLPLEYVHFGYMEDSSPPPPTPNLYLILLLIMFDCSHSSNDDEDSAHPTTYNWERSSLLPRVFMSCFHHTFTHVVRRTQQQFPRLLLKQRINIFQYCKTFFSPQRCFFSSQKFITKLCVGFCVLCVCVYATLWFCGTWRAESQYLWYESRKTSAITRQKFSYFSNRNLSIETSLCWKCSTKWNWCRLRT